MEEKATQAMEIAEFVPLEKIDPVYFDKALLPRPREGRRKAYRLLAQAMRRPGAAALAQYAARGKQYLVLLRPEGARGRLMMQPLIYDDEVRRSRR